MLVNLVNCSASIISVVLAVYEIHITIYNTSLSLTQVMAIIFVNRQKKIEQCVSQIKKYNILLARRFTAIPIFIMFFLRSQNITYYSFQLYRLVFVLYESQVY